MDLGARVVVIDTEHKDLQEVGKEAKFVAAVVELGSEDSVATVAEGP